MIRSRISAAVMVGALALLTVGVPAVAAGGGPTTRFVDDDGQASASSCNSSTSAFSTIQAAVNASGPTDIVRVCPGSYQEQVKIGAAKTNLELRSVEDFGARILSPAVLDSAKWWSLVDIRAQGVIVRGFKIVSYAMSTGCEKVFAGVLVEPGASAVVRGNRFFTAGDETLGSCGYAFGVWAGIVPLSSAGFEDGPLAKVNVLWNIIKDFQEGGAVAFGNAKARIDQNSIQYLHGGVSPFAPELTSGAPRSRMAGRIDPQGVCQSSTSLAQRGAHLLHSLRTGGPAGGACGEAFGIAYAFGGYGVAKRNVIYSAALCKCQQVFLFAGILAGIPVATADDPIIPARDILLGENLVTISLVNYLLSNIRDVTMTDNTGTINEAGLYLTNADFNSISGHQNSDGGAGISVSSDSKHNVIEDSDFRGNGSNDCTDESNGPRTGGTANTWSNVQGDDANRPDICIPGVAPVN